MRPIEVSTTVRGKVLVGPNGLARPVPRSARVTITGKDPYDLDIRLNWDDDEQRLVPDDVRITRRPDGRPIRVAELARIRFGDTIAASLATEVLDTRGWAGIIEDHPRADPAAVDALIYSLAHALGTHNPTQTVSLARGLQPGSAIKRVMRARRTLPPTRAESSCGWAPDRTRATLTGTARVVQRHARCADALCGSIPIISAINCALSSLSLRTEGAGRFQIVRRTRLFRAHHGDTLTLAPRSGARPASDRQTATEPDARMPGTVRTSRHALVDTQSDSTEPRWHAASHECRTAWRRTSGVAARSVSPAAAPWSSHQRGEVLSRRRSAGDYVRPWASA